MSVNVINNLCQDCSSNLQEQSNCHENGSNCINSPNHVSTSFERTAIERRIQNQSRMPSSQYRSALNDVTVAQGILSFDDVPQEYYNISSDVWGDKSYLRNQSDRSRPSRSALPGYVNVPTRGNSTRGTITGNRPGAMTPGGEGVDVKHGSYSRYLAKKKGYILTKQQVSFTTTPSSLEPWRRGFVNGAPNTVYNSASINNMSFKFTPVSLNVGADCKDCNSSFLNPNNN